jgi:4-amino-4-deoxy-L-arabinose transferase-like glycosyltransferase
VHTAGGMVEDQGRDPGQGRARYVCACESIWRWVRVRRVALGWSLLFAGISFALRWPFFRVPLNADEGGYAYVARRWLDGRGELYADVWVSRPQGIFLAYGAIFRTLGTSVEAIHVGSWLIGLATALFVWFFTRDWLGRRAGLAAIFLFILINGSPYLEGFTANAEVFAALPAAAAAWLLLRASRRGWSAGSLLAIGVLAAISTLLKPSGIVMLPVAIAFVCLMSGSQARAAMARSVWIAAGFAFGIAPSLIHGWLIGWHDFVFASITYRLEFQSSATVSAAHHWQRLTELLRHCRALAAAVGTVVALRWASGLSWPVAPAPWVAPRVTGLVAEPFFFGRTAPRSDEEAGGLLLRLWLLGCIAGIAMGGDWWEHYLIQIAAPLAIWLVAALRELAGRLDRIRYWAVVLAMLTFLLGQYWVVAIGDPDRISSWLYQRDDYVAADEVAAYLRAHTSPETPIYIAFSQPAISYQADRPSPYRYLYPQELWALPGTQDALIALIESPSRPLYIVDAGQRAPFPDDGRAFWTAVASRYHLETTIGGLGVYRADRPYETTPSGRRSGASNHGLTRSKA